MIRLTFLLCIFCVSCTPERASFTQGDLRIALPVTEDGYDTVTHSHPMYMINDGGTRLVKITDAVGNRFDIYIDHRISVIPSGGLKTESGTIWLNAYPGSTNALRVNDQKGFRLKVLKEIGY